MYSRKGAELVFSQSFVDSMPDFFLDGEIWYEQREGRQRKRKRGEDEEMGEGKEEVLYLINYI